MPFKYLLVSVLLIFAKNSFSQTSKKSVTAKFTNEKIIIDGKLNEAIWKNTDIATDFVYLFPENGKAVPKNLDTQVKVLYDNTAIYIGAYLKDDEPNKITKESKWITVKFDIWKESKNKELVAQYNVDSFIKLDKLYIEAYKIRPWDIQGCRDLISSELSDISSELTSIKKVLEKTIKRTGKLFNGI
jgi:hypothetical protein